VAGGGATPSRAAAFWQLIPFRSIAPATHTAGLSIALGPFMLASIPSKSLESKRHRLGNLRRLLAAENRSSQRLR